MTALNDSEEVVVAGIGASAGGLASIEKFFTAIPNKTSFGIAFVIVQHLDPNHKSILMEIVSNFTGMKVHQIEDGMRVEADNVYIIPENCDLALKDGKLHLIQLDKIRSPRLPIDQFFRSLASELGSRAIGIILSGGGSDGSLGIKEIKAESGFVLVQSPDSSEFDSMPKNALLTNAVDYVLPPEQMPAAISEILLRSNNIQPQVIRSLDIPIHEILMRLKNKTGHDFQEYKKSSLLRRIERRMSINKMSSMENYCSFLNSNDSEIHELFNDLLIGVTNFFRDPEAFEFISTKILPNIFTPERKESIVRFWCAACSTGEEAYSLAIIIREYLERTGDDSFEFQIFATDIDIQSVEKARLGIFPQSISTHVSKDRLERFFIQDEGNYRLSNKIRDTIIFAKQDLIKDPPFSKIDFISCRNLLIYFEHDLQKKVMTLFNFSLNTGGYLFLGNSESIGEDAKFYLTVNKKWKIYKRSTDSLKNTNAHRFFMPAQQKQLFQRINMKVPETYRNELKETIESNLLQHFSLPVIIINSKMDILYLFGKTGPYLEPVTGMANMNLHQMLKNNIKIETITLVRRFTQKDTSENSIIIKNASSDSAVQVTVVNFTVAGQADETYMLVFKEILYTDINKNLINKSSDEITNDHLVYLEHELLAKEGYLQTAIEEFETSNEELKSANEELQSANEELQSANEELETSKEELQSVNEELITVNQELQKKIDELSDLNNDVNNLFAVTGIATIFVDEQMVIRRFTPAAIEIVNLIHSDIGRPLHHIASNLSADSNLNGILKEVLDTLIPEEKIVKTVSKKSYIMRIQPYRSAENVVSGAVITFVHLNNYTP